MKHEVETFVIEGGRRLQGEITVQGAKNAVLPILAATILNGATSVIHNCPRLRDVTSSLEILRCLGCDAVQEGNTVRVDSSKLTTHYIPEVLMREMRSSIIFLGAILARCQQAFTSYPGGCEIGHRPIDLHLAAFRSMGFCVDESHGFISCAGRCEGDRMIHLNFPSVGATENVMLASVFGTGTVVITNAAKEPEICDLQNFLCSMGARVSGAGSDKIVIRGVSRLHEAEYSVMPDRIVAATYLCAAAATGSDITLRSVCPEDIRPVLSALRECGQEMETGTDTVYFTSKPIKPISRLCTLPHPGFPTDAQAQMMAVLSLAKGASMVVETIFENRFRHVEELIRMGADITVDGRSAVIRGIDRFCGAKVTAMDLRGGAALVIAGLNAYGTTEVRRIHHIDRGYDGFDEGLRSLGAKIYRKKTEE